MGCGDADAVAFQPTDFDLEVTPDISLTVARNGEYETGLLVALRLNERAYYVASVGSGTPELAQCNEIALKVPALAGPRISSVNITRLVFNCAPFRR